MYPVGAKGWHMIDEIDLVGLVADHAGLAQLCNELEAVADALPILPSQEERDRLREELEHRLPTHEAREIALLDALFDRMRASHLDRAILGHIAARRAACVVQAQDLVATLRGDGHPPAAETLGYMMRSFFQSCRQGMAFEELAILHVSARRLTPAARDLLRRSLEARCGV